MNTKQLILGSVAIVLLCACVNVAWGQGVDVPVETGPAVQNEISMALIPGTTSGVPQLLLGAYNDNPVVGGNGLGVSYSTDGGANWTNQQLAFPSNTIDGLQMGDAFDPSVTIDSQGNISVAHISSATGYGSISGLYVHRGTLSGSVVNWQTPVEVDSDPASVPLSAPDPNYRFNDRCQITHDPSNDDLYVGYIKDAGWYTQGAPPPLPLTAPPSDIWVAHSPAASAGAAWTPVQVNDNPAADLGNMPVPVVDANGDVYVSWLDYDVWNGGQGQIMLDVSNDSGATWGADNPVLTPVNLPPINVNDGLYNTDARAKGAPVLAASPSNAGELYLTYAEDPDGLGGDDADIMFIRSTNGGVNWSTPITLNTDVTTNDQILPWVDVKPNGTIDVVWYDRRNDPLDQLWDIFITRSIDGGLTWSQEVQINDTSFLTSFNGIGGPWIGEYMGLAVDADHAYTMWTSTVADGNGDIYFDKIANASIPEPSSLALAALALLGLAFWGRRKR